MDVFHPTTGEVRSDGADGIACWFIDTDYNEESFVVRHRRGDRLVCEIRSIRDHGPEGAGP